jgi:lycopene cyclase domain-containing protein
MIPLNYIILDAFILIFPLIFSFKWKFKYYKYFKPLSASIIIVGVSYIIWDILVTSRGDWWFDKNYLIGIEIFGLPIEEILFFIVVPFSCIFIYENLVYFIKDKKIFYNKIIYLVIAGIFIIIGIIFRTQEYTVLAMFSCALFFILSTTLFPQILKERNYWLYIVLSIIPFIIFNYFLTSLTVVHYNPEAIWGIRITTIPLEDFFYNFSMLSFYLMVYVYFKNKWIKSKNLKKEK